MKTNKPILTKSDFLWAALWTILFMAVTLYAFFHADMMKGDYSELDRAFQGMKDFFLWLMFIGVLGIIASILYK